MAKGPPPFVQLDYLYTPSKDVAADVEYFTRVLGAEVAFSIEGMGARVAMLRMSEGPPHVLLTDHLKGDRAILIYRVADLDAALRDLRARGWTKAQTLEIPMGTCCSFTTPGGHRIAVYEQSRPEVLAHFLGRRDF
jgi:predicted enzyme related to lactoylglutathione lyase